MVLALVLTVASIDYAVAQCVVAGCGVSDAARLVGALRERGGRSGWPSR
ncbi:hypothetical protein [Microbacterium sp.]